MRGHTISSAPAQLGQGLVSRAHGWTQFLPQSNPATGGGFLRTVPGDFWERLLALQATVTTSATAGIRQLQLAYANGDGVPIMSGPLSGNIGPSQVVIVNADHAPVTPPAQASQSAYNSGTASVPGALTVITSLPVLPAGWYAIRVYTGFGTVEATTGDNFGLYLGATQLAANLQAPVAGNQRFEVGTLTEYSDGVNQFSIKNVVASSAGAFYMASIQADATNGLQAPLPDMVLKSGWQVRLNLLGAQAGDAITGIGMLLERYPTGDITQLAGYPSDVLAELVQSLLIG